MAMHKLDARKMLCPMPVIRTQDCIAKLQPKDVVEVTCTDPGAINDIPTWCRINGHTVLDIKQNDREILITIEVGTD